MKLCLIALVSLPLLVGCASQRNVCERELDKLEAIQSDTEKRITALRERTNKLAHEQESYVERLQSWWQNTVVPAMTSAEETAKGAVESAKNAEQKSQELYQQGKDKASTLAHSLCPTCFDGSKAP